MRTLYEAILNRKQTTSDILSSPEEQLRLFNQAFRRYYHQINMSILALPAPLKDVNKNNWL